MLVMSEFSTVLPIPAIEETVWQLGDVARCFCVLKINTFDMRQLYHYHSLIEFILGY